MSEGTRTPTQERHALVEEWLPVLVGPMSLAVVEETGTFQGEPYRAFVAQSKEFDYAAQADTEAKCLRAFNRGLVATVLANVAAGNHRREGDACPDDVWAECCAKAATKWKRGGPSWLGSDAGDGNQHPSGLRGDPIVPGTVNGEARDKGIS